MTKEIREVREFEFEGDPFRRRFDTREKAEAAMRYDARGARLGRALDLINIDPGTDLGHLAQIIGDDDCDAAIAHLEAAALCLDPCR